MLHLLPWLCSLGMVDLLFLCFPISIRHLLKGHGVSTILKRYNLICYFFPLPIFFAGYIPLTGNQHSRPVMQKECSRNRDFMVFWLIGPIFVINCYQVIKGRSSASAGEPQQQFWLSQKLPHFLCPYFWIMYLEIGFLANKMLLPFCLFLFVLIFNFGQWFLLLLFCSLTLKRMQMWLVMCDRLKLIWTVVFNYLCVVHSYYRPLVNGTWILPVARHLNV